VVGEKTLDVHVGDLTIPTRFVVSSNVTEPMLGINWLRSNRIIWDFAKDLLIVNGEVFDMILEERSQELKRTRWLETQNEEDESRKDATEIQVIERVSEDTTRGNERSPPTLEMEPIYRNLIHSPVVSRTHSPLQPYHIKSSSPPSSSYNGHLQYPLPACASDGSG